MEAIGGQAVFEGIMIKSPNFLVVAVRKPDGKIAEKIERLSTAPKPFRLVFLRGIYNLINVLGLGFKALSWSATQSGKEEKLEPRDIALVIGLSILLALAFFGVLPYVLTHLLGLREETNPLMFNLVDGIIKLLLFILYVFAIGQFKEIRRVFEYHGAEHKVIACYEKGLKLTHKNIKQCPTNHARCGTSFIILVLCLSILVFSLIPLLLVWLFPGLILLSFLIRRIIMFGVRLLALPLIAGIAYEGLRLGGRLQNKSFFNILLLPGLMVQKLVTREPSREQVEVAIFALKRVLELEGLNPPAAPSP